MARPTRQGVDYFPLDIHLDDKFKFIQIKYGLEGFAVVIKLMQKIYSYGYWYQWGEDEVLIFAHENNIDKDVLLQIVQESIERDIFDKELYDKYSILTSSGIQKRYKEIVRRRKDVEVVEEYLLVDNNFGVNVSIVPTQCKHSDDKSTQSKVEESRVKDSSSSNDDFSKLVQAFEQNGFGTLNITTKDLLVALIDDYSYQWTLEAIKLAVKSNKRNLRYVEGILKSWKAEGKDNKKKKGNDPYAGLEVF